MYIPCTNLYMVIMARVVLYTDGYIHIKNVQTSLNCVYTLPTTLMYPFGCSFFICPAGWPVGCCQVSDLFKFKHTVTSLIGSSL